LSAGTHLVEWVYEKDASLSSGRDSVWLDSISVRPLATAYGPDGFYRFDLDEPQRLRLELTAEWNAALELYDESRGVSVGYADAGTTGTEVLQADLAPGRYRLRVDGASSSARGPYELFLRSYEPLIADTFSTAFDVDAVRDLATESASFSGTTVGLNDNDSTGYYGLYDGEAWGNDAYYRFTLDASQRVLISLRGETHDAVLALYRGDGSLIQGVDSTYGAPSTETIDALLEAGTYVVRVDGFGGGNGRYTLTLGAYTPMRYDALADAYDVDDVTNVGKSFSGTTANSTHDPVRSPNPGRDVYYRFTLDDTRSMRISLQSSSPSWDSTLRLLDASGNAIAGQGMTVGGWSYWDDLDGTMHAQLHGGSLGPGTYYVVVDGFSTTSAGNYVLDLQPSPPLAAGPGTWTSPRSLGNLSDASLSVTGHTSPMPDSIGTCGASTLDGSEDAVYTFTLDGPRTVSFSLRRSTGNVFDTRLAVVALSGGASVGGAASACNDDAGGTLLSELPAQSLTQGTYAVVVQGYGGAEGNYRLDIQVTRPVQGDNSTNAIDAGDLTATNKTFTTTDGTCALANDVSGDTACGTAGTPVTPGRDAFYRFTLTAERRVRATVSSTAFTPQFWIRPVSGSPASIASNAGTRCPTGATVTDDWTLAAGTYELIVDTPSTTACGNYTLQLQTFADTYLGDDTTNAVAGTPVTTWPLDLTNVGAAATTVGTSTTCDLRNQFSPSCGGASARDAVYRFRLFGDRRVTLNLTSVQAGFTPTVSIRDAATNTEVAGTCVAAASAGANVSVTANLTGAASTGTEYYVIVDGVGTTCGSYRLDFSSSYVTHFGDLLPAPAGTGPALTGTASDLGDLTSQSAGGNFLSGGTIGRTGSTMCALLDNIDAASSSCGAAGAPDAVYQFSISARRDIRVLMRASGFTPTVSIRRAGAPSTRLTATDGSTTCASGAPVDRTWTLDPGGVLTTYYLVIEAPSATSCGTYDLSVLSTGITGTVGDRLTGAVPGIGPAPVCDPLASCTIGDLTNASYSRLAATTCDLGDDVDSTTTGCGTTGAGVLRRDAVHSFRLTAPRRVAVSVSPATGFTPVVTLRAASAPNTVLARMDLGTCVAGTTTQTYDLGATASPATPIDYLLVVDSADASCGSYTLNLQSTAITVQAESRTLLGTGGDLGNLTTPTAQSVRVTDARSLCDLADDVTSSCSASGTGRRDAVYRFALDAPRRITARLRSMVGFDGVLSIRDASDNEVMSAAGAYCTNTSTTGDESLTVNLPAPAANTVYYVVVDSYDSACTTGSYLLDVDVETLTLTGDTSGSPHFLGNLTSPTSTSATATGSSTCDLNDDVTSSCSSAGPLRRDAVYSFTLSAPRRVTVSVTPQASSPGFNPTLELRGPTPSFTTLSGTTCTNSAGAGVTGTESILVPTLDAGTYWVVVDSADGTCGNYTLDVQTADAGTVGDSFASPYDVDDLTSRSARYDAGSTCDLADDHAPSSCITAAGSREAVYRFNVTSSRRVSVSLRTRSGRPPFDYVLSLRDAAFNPLAPSASSCVNGGGSGEMETVAWDLAAGGTYYAVVDSNGAGCGDYRLEFQTTAGDTLATAIPLDISTGAGAATGTTDSTILVDNLRVDAAMAGAGPDVFYSFTLAAPRRVKVTLTPNNTTYNPVVAIRTGPDTADVIRSAAVVGAGVAETVEADLLPGTYYVQVDGAGSLVSNLRGPYTVSLQTAEVVGDFFSNPIDAGNLTNASASYTGDTTGLFRDSNACGVGLAGNGPDAFYVFRLDERREVQVTLSPSTSAYNAVFSLLTSTGAVVPGSCTATVGGGLAETRTMVLDPGTYYVQVDGADDTAGRYQLDIVTRIRVGDTWTDPVDMRDITARSAAYTGDTTGLADNGDPTSPTTSACGGVGPPDAFYRFTLTETTYLQLDTYGSGSDTVLGVYSSTGASVGCNDDAGGVESSIAGTFRAGTYYVRVDGKSGPVRYALNVRVRTQDYERRDPTLAFDLGDLTLQSAGATGSTCQMASDYDGASRSCATAGSGLAGDTVFKFRLDDTRLVTVDTDGSGFDTVLRILDATGAERGCDDDGGAVGLASRLERTLEAGTYYIVVDSYGDVCGDYRLSVNVSNGGGSAFSTVRWADALSALNARDIDVIVVQSGSTFSGSIQDGDALCDGTGTVRAAPSCPAGQTPCDSGASCCVGSTRMGSSTRYRYNIASDGTGLGTTVVEAVRDLTQYRRMDITAEARDNTSTTDFDERTFVSSIVATSFAADRCVGITGGTRFEDCLPGTMVNFQVNFIGVVAPTTMPQTFRFNIVVLGDDSIVLGTYPVTIVVPPRTDTYAPSGSYTREFDGATTCNPTTELPLWRSLTWNATTPSDSNIRWSLRLGNTAAELDAATPISFSAPPTVSPAMLQDRLLAAGLPGSSRLIRVTATLNSSTDRTAAPVLSSFQVEWSCQPAM
jgi:hypothetical protein